VPLTSTIRGYRSEVTIEPDPDNGLEATSAAQCQHTRAIALGRLADPLANIGPQALTQIRKIALTSSTCSDPHDATVVMCAVTTARQRPQPPIAGYFDSLSH
jgi:hypothetical protein